MFHPPKRLVYNQLMNKLSLFRRTPVEDRLKRFHGEDWQKPKGRIIRDIVYALDTGLITMVAFMAGVSVFLRIAGT